MSRSGMAVALSCAILASSCFRGSRHGLAFLETAIITAAIVSTIAPPPPRVIYVPEPRPGYTWQPGYWMREDDEWVWVDGRWIHLPPNYQWAPSHWEQAPDGTWTLIPGQWVPLAPPTPAPH